MSLTDNLQNVAYWSGANIDKIVKVFEGSYNMATDVTARTDGFTGTLYVYPILHGFTRPVFTTLLWSTDNITYYDGGALLVGAGTISFSDSTNVYVGSPYNVGTMYYKVVCTWIDDYDETNPLVESFTPAVDKVLFDSRSNYQKIYSAGSTTYPAGSAGSANTTSIIHTLNYKPNAKVFFEPIANEVWPLNMGGASNPFLYTGSQDEALMKIYTDRVDIETNRYSNAVRRLWYRIYYDA